jgi:cell division protein FtsB
MANGRAGIRVVYPSEPRQRTGCALMKHLVLTIAAVAFLSAFGQVAAQTSTQMLEHIDDLGKRNERLQERVRTLEQENRILRERLRELEIAEPAPTPMGPEALPPAAHPNLGERTPAAPRIVVPLPPPAAGAGAPAASLNGTIDLDSDPPGAQAATSLGSGCQTPCAMEISADAPFTVTFTHPGYAPSTVSIGMQPGQPGVSGPKFSPNPVFVQLTPQSRKKPAALPPRQLTPR